MTTLEVQKREMDVKPKKLRREGFIPGVIVGHEMDPMPIQVGKKDAEQYIKKNKKGEQVQLIVGKKKMNAMLKDFTYNAMKKEVEVLDFQALVKGEKIHATAEIVLKNEEMANGCVTQKLSEIHYKATPEHLIDTIVLDFEKLKDVKEMKVSDLEVFNDKNIQITMPHDSEIFSVVAGNVVVDDDEESEDEATEE